MGTRVRLAPVRVGRLLAPPLLRCVPLSVDWAAYGEEDEERKSRHDRSVRQERDGVSHPDVIHELFIFMSQN